LARVALAGARVRLPVRPAILVITTMRLLVRAAAVAPSRLAEAVELQDMAAPS
jgi:hypothetical protein